jgi:glycosyltransferase involved in cell wall biosynthesis
MVTIGGAEKMVFAALGFFREQGAAVHCLVNDWQNEPVVAEAERIGATWSETPYNLRLRWRNQKPVETLRGITATFSTAADLLKQARRFRPSVIIVSDFEAILRNAVALLIMKRRRVPVVLYLHNSPPPEKPYPALFRRVISPLVTQFVVVSRSMGGDLEAIGISPGKFTYVIKFVAGGSHALPVGDRDPGCIVFAGQMIPQKGLDILLEAFALVVAKHPNATLEIATKTDGWVSPPVVEYRDEVLARAQKPDLSDRVRFLGWHKDVPGLLARAAVHCAPSRPELREGMPLVCLEAKAAATPSVVPNFGPFIELVTDRVDGWLCRGMSPKDVAEGLEYFLSSAERSRAAGVAAFESSARFSRAESERRWLEVFEKMEPEAGW